MQTEWRLANIFSVLDNPFAKYMTEHMRMKAFAGKGMVEPKAVSVGTRLETVSHTLKTVTCQVQYVPILGTLQKLFSNKSFIDSLLTERR